MSHEENTRNMQLDINHLRRKLCRNNVEGLLQAQRLPLKMIMMIVIGPDQGLHLVSLIHMMRTAIIDREVKVHLTKAWVMML